MKKITLIFTRGVGGTLHQSADLVTDKVLAEWVSFKEIMFGYCCLFQSSVDKKIAKETDQNVISQLIKQWKEYTPAAFFNDVSNVHLCYDLHPRCMYLLKLSMMFPLSVAFVERLFSKMKLIKTHLPNQLGQLSLLLCISPEGPENFKMMHMNFLLMNSSNLIPIY